MPCAALAQSAASYPAKAMRVVVPLAQGGPTDTFARMFACHLETKYKQLAVVENKTGAGQVAGANYALQQPADGYTMLAGSNGLAYFGDINNLRRSKTGRLRTLAFSFAWFSAG